MGVVAAHSANGGRAATDIGCPLGRQFRLASAWQTGQVAGSWGARPECPCECAADKRIGPAAPNSRDSPLRCTLWPQAGSSSARWNECIRPVA